MGAYLKIKILFAVQIDYFTKKSYYLFSSLELTKTTGLNIFLKTIVPLMF